MDTVVVTESEYRANDFSLASPLTADIILSDPVADVCVQEQSWEDGTEEIKNEERTENITA